MDRQTLFFQRSITHVIFADHMIVHKFWAQQNIKMQLKKKEDKHNPLEKG